jgi:drug/metabolite transporter (DMT)-like permease
VTWGAADFCGGIATRLSNTLVATSISQATGLGLSALLLLVSAEPMPTGDALAWAAFAGVSGTLGVGAFYVALSRGTMGLVAPLTALLAASIPALVGIATGDALSPLVVAGMAAALGAVVLISMPDPRLGAPRLPTLHGSRAREWLFILGASAGFAGFFLAIDAAHGAGGGVWWTLFTVKLLGVASIGSVSLVLLAAHRVPPVRFARAGVLVALAGGVADLGGNLFFVLASGPGELSTVVVLSSLYPVVTALLARLFLHERLGPLRLAGVALAIAGVVLIGQASL